MLRRRFAVFPLICFVAVPIQLAAQENFKGKTIKIIAGFPSGGAVDLEARLLARFMERYIPFQRGESDIYATANLKALQELTASGFQPFVQQGRLRSSGSFQRRPDFPNVPTFAELLDKKRPTGAAWDAYVSWAGSDGAGRPLFAPPKTPRNRAYVSRCLLSVGEGQRISRRASPCRRR